MARVRKQNAALKLKKQRNKNQQHNFLNPPTVHTTETEPLPPELQPLVADGDDVNATDPVVQLFLRRQRRMKEVKKRREAGVLERLERFAVKKYYTIRRG